MKTYKFREYRPQSLLRLNERKDCTVRALSLMIGSYERAHKILKDAGRKERKGFPLAAWLDSLEVLEGMKIDRVKIVHGKGKEKMTPTRFCEKYNKGSYIVCINSHAFAVINGVIHDSFRVRPGTRVFWAWEFTECPWEDGTIMQKSSQGGGCKFLGYEYFMVICNPYDKQ